MKLLNADEKAFVCFTLNNFENCGVVANLQTLPYYSANAIAASVTAALESDKLSPKAVKMAQGVLGKLA